MPERLVREIGRWDLCAIVINTIIGAGIFGLPSKVYALIGVHSLAAFVVCALIIGLIVLCYAEVASRFSTTGGPYLYAREAFGPLIGFEVGWLYWVVRVATFAANCNLLVMYGGFFWPPLTDGPWRIATIMAVTLAIVGVNVAGVRQSATLTNMLTAGKLLPLFLFVVVGTCFIDPAHFAATAVPDARAFSSAVLILLYAYVGFEAAVVLGGEFQRPQQDIPFALLVSLSMVALLYLAIQAVCIGTYPALAESERPLADAALRLLGPLGAALVTAGALVSILGNVNVGMLGASRLLFAMATQGDVPGVLGATHARFKSPHWAIAVTGATAFVLTVQSTFLSAVAIATITRLLVYASTCLALPVFRRRSDRMDAGFHVSGGVAVAAASLLLIGWLLAQVDLKSEGMPILLAAAVGLALRGCNRLISSQRIPPLGSSPVRIEGPDEP